MKNFPSKSDENFSNRVWLRKVNQICNRFMNDFSVRNLIAGRVFRSWCAENFFIKVCRNFFNQDPVENVTSKSDRSGSDVQTRSGSR
jgi:hypothetical protein